MAKNEIPAILAPAGDEDSFLAALAAGADAIYLGLKRFSARMQAKNFDLARLGRLCELAARKNCRVNVAFNNMLRQDELESAFQLLRALAANTGVSGLIVQDLAMVNLAAQARFGGTLTLSTLAALTDAAGLQVAATLGIDRVVLPRELSVDEMRVMADACPPGLELECFVHGALCYSISGRCWWSSYMGGKSGLRGHCVQPCRRLYSRRIRGVSKGGERFFSCQDLQLGELVKLLLDIPKIGVWKIEGRKKGPHYVYYTVMAYRILRDYPQDAQKRKMALQFLEAALGRRGVKGRFLPRENRFPMDPSRPTGSGRLLGRLHSDSGGAVILRPQHELLSGDYLRIGSQDERCHALVSVGRHVPKGGTFHLRLPKHKTPASGTMVYLVDRREPELEQQIAALRKDLKSINNIESRMVPASLSLPQPCRAARLPDMEVLPCSGRLRGENRFYGCLARKGKAVAGRMPDKNGEMKSGKVTAQNIMQGIWLVPGKTRSAHTGDVVYWLPPVIFPEQEKDYIDAINRLLAAGAGRFVCNAPWQRGLFPGQPENIQLYAGPFCNIANSCAIETLQKLGFCAAFASPELAAKDITALAQASPLPLGFVLAGFWPVSISRFGLVGVDVNEPFSSPMGESFWARNNSGLIWIYPSWPLDMSALKGELLGAGIAFFAVILENPPRNLPASNRPGLFNWAGELA